MTDPVDDQRRTQVTRLDRHESAIMLTDIVGYTRIMRANEERALQLLDEHNSIVRDSIDRHTGFVAKVMGDAFLAEFFDPEQSVACAIDIQRRLQERNKSVPEERQVSVRIGLHYALVTPMGSDIMGDGVNVVSRIEPLSPPGGVCLSSALYAKVKGSIGVQVRDLGPQNLKNIDEPVHLFQIDPLDGAASPAGADDPVSVPDISLSGIQGTTLGAEARQRPPWKFIGIGAAVAAVLGFGGWKLLSSSPAPRPTPHVEEVHRKPEAKTEPSPAPPTPDEVHPVGDVEPPKQEVHDTPEHHAVVLGKHEAALQARLKKDLARLEKVVPKKQKKIAPDAEKLIRVERELSQGRRDLDLKWLERRLDALERELPKG